MTWMKSTSKLHHGWISCCPFRVEPSSNHGVRPSYGTLPWTSPCRWCNLLWYQTVAEPPRNTAQPSIV